MKSNYAFAFGLLATLVTHINAQDACKESPTDVIFLVDVSMSANTDFHTAMNFVEGVVSKFSVSVYDTKIALVKFGTNYKKIFSLATYTNRDDVLQAIRATTRNCPSWGCTSSHSDLGDALSFTKSTLIRTYYGRRPSAKLVVIVVTTKTDSISGSVSQNAQELKNHGATIYAIGVGPLIPDSVLTTIATDNNHKFPVTSFSGLVSIQDIIVNSICPAQSVGASVGGFVTKDDCPTGVARDDHLQLYNGICYQFVTYRTRNFNVAQRECEVNGGTLVIINDAATDLFIYNELKFTYKVHAGVWIGLKDNNPNYNNHFRWVDGSEVTYTNFNTGSHSGWSRQCVAMDVTSAGGGKWNKGYHCDSSHSVWSASLNYVCQYISTTTTIGSTTRTPSTAAQTTPAPTTHVPTTPVPITPIPTTPIPTTPIPTTPIPTTPIPTTPNPTTPIPTTPIPTTPIPTTPIPTTPIPTTPIPTTPIPTTPTPTTPIPTTAIPTTPIPTTPVPTTPVTTTTVPTTPIPTTPIPTTPIPTTPVPTTPVPTTPVPTTPVPTSPVPTTPVPTTPVPTTPVPTTTIPTTTRPTTIKPSTLAPTTLASTTNRPVTAAPIQCPPFKCDKDCGMDGYTVDAHGCSVCKCG